MNIFAGNYLAMVFLWLWLWLSNILFLPPKLLQLYIYKMSKRRVLVGFIYENCYKNSFSGVMTAMHTQTISKLFLEMITESKRRVEGKGSYSK